MKILVTGATGNVGGELAKELSGAGVSFHAFVRSPAKAKESGLAALPGVALAPGDLDDAESLAKALAGVERAFLVTDSSEHAERRQLAFVRAARHAGVKYVVKLSQWAASPESPVRFLRYHAVVEQALRDSGMAYTFLRPNLFMQSLLGFAQTIREQGQLFAPAGDAPVSVIDVRDIAASARAALTDARHEGKTYSLTGPRALTHAEIAAEIGEAIGKTVRYTDVPPAALREALGQMGMNAWQADGTIEDYAHYHRGEAAEVTTGVREATGREPRAFTTFARDYAAAFRD